MSSLSNTATIRYLDTSNTKTRVVEDGNGPTIVWVPGGDAPAEYWVDQWERLSRDFRCISYDPRGVGETTSVPTPWTIEDFADDLAEIIQQICEPPVIVTGLSMGGLITQAVAIRHPNLVKLAIPMGTAAYIDGYTRYWMDAEINFRKAGYKMPIEFAVSHYAAFAYPANALADPVVWEKIKTAYGPRFGDRNPEQLIAQWQACLDFDCRETLKTCPVPIHAIGFSEDVQTPPPMVKEVADLAQKGTFHELSGMGHVSFARHKPDEVAQLLRQIIRLETS